jgi:hypothetical protein
VMSEQETRATIVQVDPIAVAKIRLMGRLPLMVLDYLPESANNS